MMSLSRAAWTVACAAILLVVIACGREAVPLIQVLVSDDGRTLLVPVAACDDREQLTVDEDEDRVVLTATIPRKGYGHFPECGIEKQVELDDPLGDRVVIDGSTQEELPVTTWTEGP